MATRMNIQQEADYIREHPDQFDTVHKVHRHRQATDCPDPALTITMKPTRLRWRFWLAVRLARCLVNVLFQGKCSLRFSKDDL